MKWVCCLVLTVTLGVVVGCGERQAATGPSPEPDVEPTVETFTEIPTAASAFTQEADPTPIAPTVTPALTPSAPSTILAAATPVSAPSSTPQPTATATNASTPTSIPSPHRTSTPAPTTSPTPTPTPIPILTPAPTATPTPAPKTSPNYAERFDLAIHSSEGLLLHYDPDTPRIQLGWVLDAYDKALKLLIDKLEVSAPDTTMYLLSREVYAQVYSGNHPEWTQGFAQGNEAFINRYPVRVWDASVTKEERTEWAAGHLQEITQRTTVHELTHVALGGRQLPSWINEGMAEYIESFVAPSKSAFRQLLQRRYLIRGAATRGGLPTDAQLAAPDWFSIEASEEELSHMYALSALITQLAADNAGDAGLRRLIETKDMGMPLGEFLESELLPWLQTLLPEEMAATVLCGLNESLGVNNRIVADWNSNENQSRADHAEFIERIQHLIDFIDNLAKDTIVEEARLTYVESHAEWIASIEAYMARAFRQADAHVLKSNSLKEDAGRLFSNAWEEYIVAPCELIEEQLQTS